MANNLRNFAAAAIPDNLDNINGIINNITSDTGSPVSVRGAFLNVLESWETALPLQSLWMVFFTVPDIVNDRIMSEWGENIIYDRSNETGSIDTTRNLLIRPMFQKLTGCAFAQSVQLPPESVSIDHVGIPNSRGFLSGPVMNQRQRFSSVNIEFLETNTSFVDFLIRPWVILSSHFGGIARPTGPGGSDVKLTTDIVVVNLSRAGVQETYGFEGNQIDLNKLARDKIARGTDIEYRNERGFTPRKVWIFSGASPITVPSSKYSYTGSGDIERRDTEWVFKRYQVILPSRFSEIFRTIANNDEKLASKGVSSISSMRKEYVAKGARILESIKDPMHTEEGMPATPGYLYHGYKIATETKFNAISKRNGPGEYPYAGETGSGYDQAMKPKYKFRSSRTNILALLGF